MKLLMQSNDVVLISFVKSLLNDEGIDYLVADENISVLEGSIGIFPRRVLVVDDQLPQAERLMKDADLGQHLALKS